ncbi:MAG: GNAT family N-acetyltransferase [Bacteriovorax sp.]
MQKKNLTETYQGHAYRVTSFVDQESLAFENELTALLREHNQHHSDEVWELFGQNRCHYVEIKNSNCYLIQIKNPKNGPLTQLVIQVEPKKIFKLYSGQINRWCRANLGQKDCEIVLGIIHQFISKHTSLMSLRLQMFDFSPSWHLEAQKISEKFKFKSTENNEYTHTRALKLNGTDEELLASVPPKTRAKIRNKSHENFIIKELRDVKYIPALKKAIQHSFMRSADLKINLKFDDIMNMAIKYPEKCRIIGYAKKTDPDLPLAFVVGIIGEGVCEYYMAGSLSDPELRSIPFNYLLVWNLILWGKQSGAKMFDYGGISDEGPNDPTANISYFKRRFPAEEYNVASESLLITSPFKWFSFLFMKKIQTVTKSVLSL